LEAVDEANVDQVLRLLMAGKCHEARFLQPPHWIGEVAAVLVRRTPTNAWASVKALLELEFVMPADHPHYFQRAITLSHNLDHHLFDTLYHAVALEEDATLITADRRYFQKAHAMGGIMMLEEFGG
jgi:predicted nucleic acid-binding protein